MRTEETRAQQDGPVLRIFSDREFLPPGCAHAILLYPFWGKNPEKEHELTRGRFDAYEATGRRCFEAVPLAQAGLAVVPYDWFGDAPNPLASRLIAQASAAGKRSVVFCNRDFDGEISVTHCTVFRTSFYRSKRKPWEFAQPTWSEDLVERYLGGRLPLREKSSTPTVGYCGYAAPERDTFRERWVAPLRRVRGGSRLLGALRVGINEHPGARLRARAVWLLARSASVRTNFLLRRAFWNGALDGPPDAEFLRQTRQEFVQNMMESDYILCVRGAGNFSYRLYETLSCGRIPVFVDTDCVLPCEEWIDWRNLCVWVDQTDLPHIAERVAAFHDALSPAEFEERQRECRRVWEQWLSPTGFFANFHRHFESGTSEQSRQCAS